MEATNFKNVIIENILLALFEVTKDGSWNFIETKKEQNYIGKFIKMIWTHELSDHENGL